MSKRKASEETRLKIDSSRVNPEGEVIEGEVGAVDLQEELFKAVGNTRYSLRLQVFGTELLARGSLAQDFTLACSRCGKDFNTTITVDDFTASFEISEKNPEIDLTDELRESIILALPTYPVCDEGCPGILQKEQTFSDNRWSALDGLKVS